ncbi:MAG TPA: hypothetical protein VG938_03930 [Verrucomicrobiae bacterium]|jgi:tetratricopeptide (TPR) repeat protein|nr:hypothetical protein [Verrucomicrobiae bacterium]
MPVFGDYTTIGEPVAVVEERGHVSTVWQARLSGASDGRLYAVKAYSPRRRASKEGESSEELENDRRLEFINGIKELKKAQTESGGSLAPVHAFGMAPEGAWYATDFYPRSLKTWINLRVRADGAALSHLVASVVAACLAMKRARGFSHGNLKTSNIFLAGKPRPLRHTPLFLSDPYPASSTQLARLDVSDREVAGELLNQTAEVQDLRAIGELLLQLVEGRLIGNSYDYNYPVAKSPAWEQLGREGERWRERCNRLLDPQLTLEKINLESLKKEFRPSAMPGKIAVIAGGVAVVCLVGGGIFYAVSLHGRKKAAEFQDALRAATDALNHTNFVVAKQQIQQALEQSPGDAGALKLQEQISQALESRYNTALQSAQAHFKAGDFDNAVVFAKQALDYKPGDAAAGDVVSGVEREQKFQSTMAGARDAFRQSSFDRAVELAEQAVGIKPDDAAAIALRDQASSNVANIQLLAKQKEQYQNEMTAARSASASGDYSNALAHAEVALGIVPNDRAALALQKEAQSQLGEAVSLSQKRKNFQQALAAAQKAFDQGNYTNAITLANQALGIIPREANARKLVDDAETQLKRMQETADQNRKYQEAMAGAQRAMQTNGYAVAITFCDQALGISRGDEAATKLRLEAQKNLDGIVADREREAKYQASMKQATAASAGNDYSNAVLFANQALTIKPQDPSAKSLLADAQAKLDAVRNAQEQAQKYQTAIAEAQAAFEHGKYDVATQQADAALASRNNDRPATVLKQQVADIQSGEKYFDSGDYDSALALTAKYPGVNAFTVLAQKVNAPRNALSDARTRFDAGDYSFIGKLDASEYAKKPAFATLLTDAKGENQTLQNLEKLTNSPANWSSVKDNFATVPPKVAGKPPFQQIGKWVEQNDPVKLLDAQLQLLRVWFGQRAPDDSIIDPNTHVRAGRLDPNTQIEAIRSFATGLSAKFDSLHELTPTRKGYFKDLEGAMNRW